MNARYFCQLTEPQRVILERLKREGSIKVMECKNDLRTLNALMNKRFVKYDQSRQEFMLADDISFPPEIKMEQKTERWPAVYNNVSREEHVNKYLNTKI